MTVPQSLPGRTSTSSHAQPGKGKQVEGIVSGSYDHRLHSVVVFLRYEQAHGFECDKGDQLEEGEVRTNERPRRCTLARSSLLRDRTTRQLSNWASSSWRRAPSFSDPSRLISFRGESRATRSKCWTESPFGPRFTCGKISLFSLKFDADNMYC